MNATSLELQLDLSPAEIDVPMPRTLIALAVTVALFSVNAPGRLASAIKAGAKARPAAHGIVPTAVSYPLPAPPAK